MPEKSKQRLEASMHIVIGSTNPIKFAASQAVLRRVFPHAHFSSQNAPSGVSAQPWGEEETRQGALNRAEAILAHTNADLGIGLEGGVIETPFGMMTTAWCAILAQTGKMGLGGGIHLLLPESVAQALRQGAELGTAMDALSGQTNTKQKQGAIGILTNGLLDRQHAYEIIIQLAVAPFCRPDVYDEVNL